MKIRNHIIEFSNEIESVDGDYLSIGLGKWNKDHKLSTPIGTQTQKWARQLRNNNY